MVCKNTQHINTETINKLQWQVCKLIISNEEEFLRIVETKCVMNYLVPLKCTRIVSAWLSAPKKTPCFIPKWLWFSRVQGNSSLVLFWDQQLFSRSFRISFRITACKMFEIKNQKTPLCVLRYIYIHCFECTCLFALKTNSFRIMSTFILSPFVFYCTNNFCVHIYREIYLPLLFKTLHSWSATWEGKKTNLIIPTHWSEGAIRHLPHIFPLSL